MSTGGIFQLITNDGKQDRMLLATGLLNQRLLQIESMRAQNPNIQDPTPTLVDIERTHILFMNAHFKPFCAIGYEYNKVAIQSGAARLGATGVQFSIPQFGDFFNDMVFHITLDSVTATNASYWNDTTVNEPDGAELVAYVDYVGQALLQQVSFTVNGNPLDQYTSDVMNFTQKFYVTPNKSVGWKRSMGQEVPWEGFTNVNNANGNFGRGAGVRQGVSIYDGPQTPKPTQPSLDLWIPALFWFNKDPRLSIPSVSIPYGQRFLNINLANANQILQQLHAYDPSQDSPGTNPVTAPDVTTCELWINNIFVNPEIHDIFIQRIGFSLIRVFRLQTTRDNKSNDNILLNQLKWPIETIFVGFRPVSNIDTTSTLMLTGWDMYCQVTPTDVDLQGLTNGYYWVSLTGSGAGGVVDCNDLSSAFRGYNGSSIDFATDLGLVGTATPALYQINNALISNGFPPLISVSTVTPLPAATSTVTPAQILANSPNTQVQSTYYVLTPTVDTLAIQAQGVSLYIETPAIFFNEYIPFTYGSHHLNTPYDVGAYMITFNLYPGSYQPSGHVNVSRAREFYINYTSSYTGVNNNSADLVVVAIAINFLLISDGSAVLRYST